MIITAPFTLDPAQAPLAQDITGDIGYDNAELQLVLEVQPGDVIEQASFTAKVNRTDADGDPTSVQVIIQNDGSGSIEALNDSPTAFVLTFPITPAQAVILETLHGYDIRVWVLRDGVIYDRTVQAGQFLAQRGWTDRTTVVGGGFTNENGAIFTQEGS